MGAKLKSELAVFYLDDGTLGGNWEDMVSDMKMIEVEARDLGFLLNRSKTELICPDLRSKSDYKVRSFCLI